MRILFVCTGNTCRSPIAESLLRDLATKSSLNLEVRSAGVSTMDGLSISEMAEAVLCEQGISVKHASQTINQELINWADIVLAMTNSHKYTLWHDFHQQKDKIYVLKEFIDPSCSVRKLDIYDPFGGDINVYRDCMQELLTELQLLISKILEANCCE